MAIHSQFTGLELHEAYHYVQETDPGAVGSNLYWLQVSTGTLKRRASDNSSWQLMCPGAYIDPTTTKGDLVTRTTTGLARLPVGTDTFVLTADSTQTTGMAWAVSSGGGGSVPAWVTNSPDNYPVTPGALDDEFTGSSLNGKWAWTNQGSAVITVANSFARFDVNTTGSRSVRMITQAVPGSTPWTITCKLITISTPGSTTQTSGGTGWVSAVPSAGLILRNSTSGKIYADYLTYDTSWRNYVQKITTNTFNSTAWYFDGLMPQNYYWQRVTNDGTNYKFYLSYNGFDFFQFGQEAVGTWITADEVGICMDAVGGIAFSLFVDYFRQT